MATPARRPATDPGEARASVVLRLPAARAWDLVADVRNHARWVPLTRVDAAPGPLPEGEELVAVTGPWARRGGGGLVDRMLVTHAEAPSGRRPGRATYRKLGPVLRGTAEVHVRPLGATLSEVTWVERIGLRGVPAAVTAVPSRLLSGAMLRLLLRRVRREVDLAAGR